MALQLKRLAFLQHPTEQGEVSPSTAGPMPHGVGYKRTNEWSIFLHPLDPQDEV